MIEREIKYNLKIDKRLYEFINNEILKGLDFKEDSFWKNFSDFIYNFAPKNKALLEKRLDLKKKIDNWHLENRGKEINTNMYKRFLEDIGYLIPEGDKFSIETNNVDKEISHICGPQLVVPITNARYALNAANARWGSFYDALYGTDVMGSTANSSEYDENRGKEVIKYAKNYLDQVFPLNNSKWENINSVKINNNLIVIHDVSGKQVSLKNKDQFYGYRLNDDNQLSELILEINNLKIRIIFNKDDIIGKKDIANISDIYFEAAISTIMDCEDSVATVDGEDKVLAYKNWLGLMKGDLSSNFLKNKNSIKRVLNSDIKIINKDGIEKVLKGRSLMLIRNVGHLMTNPAILDKDNNETPEGLLDAIITTLIAKYDLKKDNEFKNSEHKSVYIVKPKMHGPEEVAFSNELFAEVEKILNLPLYTVKLGIMDEERRTSVNLFECIRAAKNRVAFINTGFLDRTGDEIHTSMEAGAFMKKGDMKSTKWIKSYEDRNVDIGLECGLKGKAQIGKGMWAMPDLMEDMFKLKIEHPRAGANCAWVPSPTAATIHAMHYHLVNVKDTQDNILEIGRRGSLDDLLSVPIANRENWSDEEIKKEVENNCQSILGYVVRWINQGIGCSKVPDINDVGLMEDRATCRISSQILANWLKHEVISKDEFIRIMKKMAIKVDNQNANDNNYKPMSNNYDTFAFDAASRLVLEGCKQPSGYTEPILHEMRIKEKNI